MPVFIATREKLSPGRKQLLSCAESWLLNMGIVILNIRVMRIFPTAAVGVAEYAKAVLNKGTRLAALTS
ncbi:MAG: hypothetical protein PVF06_06730 [Gammaproteobacteria bacterium]